MTIIVKSKDQFIDLVSILIDNDYVVKTKEITVIVKHETGNSFEKKYQVDYHKKGEVEEE